MLHMNKLLTLILIILISACEQKTEKKVLKETDSIQENSDLSTSENENNLKNVNEPNTIEKKGKEKALRFSNGPSREMLELNEKTVIVIQMDSLEIEQLKKIDGEDNFYTASDDLMWYNSMMLEKMDSLGIPVKYTDKDTVDFYSKNYNLTIMKDSTFALYTYFYFDGKQLNKTELFELIGE